MSPAKNCLADIQQLEIDLPDLVKKLNLVDHIRVLSFLRLLGATWRNNKNGARGLLNTNFRCKPHNKPDLKPTPPPPLPTRRWPCWPPTKVACWNQATATPRHFVTFRYLAKVPQHIRRDTAWPCCFLLTLPAGPPTHFSPPCPVATGFVLRLAVAGVWLTFFFFGLPRPKQPATTTHRQLVYGHYCSYKVSALNFSSGCFCFVRCSFGPAFLFVFFFFLIQALFLSPYCHWSLFFMAWPSLTISTAAAKLFHFSFIITLDNCCCCCCPDNRATEIVVCPCCLPSTANES